MAGNLTENLAAAGFDAENALSRFGGREAMYVKYLKRYLDDPNYQALEQALEQGDYQQAFICAHTLKGVAGNLGLPFYKDISFLVELLRKEPYDREQIDERMAAAREEYETAVAQINAIE